ncbi:MAG: hypothetical protein M3384_16870 [Acidobacteriota bacterium]|nr:hypothetical protein [Acidobacteriota bacterium]
MKKRYLLPLVLISAIGVANAQQTGQKETGNKTDKTTANVSGTKTATTTTADTTSLDLAKSTLAAHGGDKLLKVKNIVVRGTADLSAGTSAQTFPAAFAITISGAKFRFDVQSQFFNFKQIYDGQQNYANIGSLSLPMDKIGMEVMRRIGDKDYTVSPLPEKWKKKRGFRVTTPEGYYTDFIVDEKTNLVKEFESSFEVNGDMLTTSVAIDKYRDVDGVLVNEKFSQRMETSQGNFYANFKAKDILVNTEIADDVFAMPK